MRWNVGNTQDKISSYQAKRIAIIELDKLNAQEMIAYKQRRNFKP